MSWMPSLHRGNSVMLRRRVRLALLPLLSAVRRRPRCISDLPGEGDFSSRVSPFSSGSIVQSQVDGDRRVRLADPDLTIFLEGTDARHEVWRSAEELPVARVNGHSAWKERFAWEYIAQECK